MANTNSENSYVGRRFQELVQSILEKEFNENIKFSVLIGSPDTCAVRAGEFFGIWEYVWEWPSERYPDNYRMEAPKELIQTEYYSRFVKGLWVVPDKTEEEVAIAAIAAIAAGKARFEYGEKPTV